MLHFCDTQVGVLRYDTPKAFGFIAFLGLLHHRLHLFLHLLHDFAELLSLLVGDFQLPHDLRVAQAEQAFPLEHHLPQPFELFFLQGPLQERRQVLLGFRDGWSSAWVGTTPRRQQRLT
jgi:hypothetical protein